MPCILATTDLSDSAARAYPVAVRLAAALHCELRLLHVVHRPVLTPAFTDSSELDRTAATAALTRVAEALRGGVPVHVAATIAEDVVAEIIGYAHTHGARYLVTAGSGKSGWSKLRLGSVSSDLLRRAPLPVVLVPGPTATPPLEPRLVALTTDLSDEAMRALPAATELAAALGLPLTLLGATADVTATAEQLHSVGRQVQTMAPQARAAVASGSDVPGAIADWAQAHGAALVCMAPRARRGLQRLLFGSVVDSVVTRLAVPTVVVPPPDQAGG